MTANRADDPFDGLPLLIPVPQAAKLLRSVRDFARKEWPCGQCG